MGHEPLSRRLQELARDDAVRTLNELVARTEGRGIFFVVILLCLPFCTPIPLPGLSNIIGLGLIILGIRMLLRLPARLPRFIGARPWPAQRMEKLIHGSLRFLRWLERMVKPRRTVWLTHGWAIRLNAAIFTLMALLLALPIPPVMPLSNTLPAYAIILLSASMMEEDGTSIWFAYGACAFTVAYFAFFFGVIIRFLIVFEERILNFLRSLL